MEIKMRIKSRFEETCDRLDKKIFEQFDSLNTFDAESFQNLEFMHRLWNSCDGDRDKYKSNLLFYYNLFLMRKSGNKTFQFNDDMALMLSNTDVKGVYHESFKTPYVSQYFYIPGNVFKVKDPLDGDFFVHGIYITYLNNYFYLLCEQPGTRNTGLNTVFPPDSKDDIKTIVKKLTIEKGMKYMEQIFNFVLNACLYITRADVDLRMESWKEVDPKVENLEGKERKRYIDRLKANHFLRVRVGDDIHLSEESKEAFITGKHRTHKTLVMGHWQHYWYAKRDGDQREKRLKWREPFWVGGEELPLKNTPHLVAV